MSRVVVLVSVVLVACVSLSLPAECMNSYQCAPPCPPPCPVETSYMTRMVPCVKTRLVPEVVQCSAVVPVPQVSYRCQPVLLKGTPVGTPCGMDPCTKCCPQPFCQMVTRQVPQVTYVGKIVPYYKVVYKPVCEPVWLPQTYKVDAIPLCR